MDNSSIFVAEMIGTAMLVTLGNGVVANQVLQKTKGHDTGWMLITTGWGLSVALAVYSVGRISGAHLNPAVTLGLVFDWSARFLNGTDLSGSANVGSHDWGDDCLGGLFFALGCDRGCRCEAWPYFARDLRFDRLIPNFFAEFVGTATLVFGVLAIGANARMN